MDYRRFKKGDTVRILQDLKIGHSYYHPRNGDDKNFYCNGTMTAYEGEVATITAVEKCLYGNIYNLSTMSGNLHWEWTDDFLEPFSKNMNNAQVAKLLLEKEHAYD